MKNPLRKKDDLYIALLRYGKTHLDRGSTLTIDDAKKFLEDGGYKFEVEYFPHLFPELFEQTSPQDMGQSAALGDPDPHTLSVSGYFQLLEHDELAQARRSSLIATYIAITAIIIGIVSAFLDT